MLILQNISYLHTDKTLLLENLSLTVKDNEKIALVGNNGTGKSTLLRIISGKLQPSFGNRKVDVEPFYVPQIFGQYNEWNVAQALGISEKLQALADILNGNITESNMSILDDDWDIEERCHQALDYWQLKNMDLNQKLGTLSGGQITRVFLSGISIHQPEFILLDEPGNHLDGAGRKCLYETISSYSGTMILVSHDRVLLNLVDKVGELSNKGLTIYGGNFDFYKEQKEIALNALDLDIRSTEKTLRKAKEKERETIERKQKQDVRGKRKQEKAGVARIMMNTIRNRAEQSTAKIKDVHNEKIAHISHELDQLLTARPDMERMRLDFDNSALHLGKVLFTASNINFSYGGQRVWNQNLTLEIRSGERIALKGSNGSGKTTLVKMILSELEPAEGSVFHAFNKWIYIDQDYSLIKNQLTVYEQAQHFNRSNLIEHEVKARLDRFLFAKDSWDKACGQLSGGERMRLMLCCLTISDQSPDIIVLDEPTNNLDIESMDILSMAIMGYKGTLIVISHDEYFLSQLKITRFIEL